MKATNLKKVKVFSTGDDKIMGKTIVIIGAAPGLGQAIANKFAQEKFNVVLVARNELKLKTMIDEIALTGVKVAYRMADVTSDTFSSVLEEIKLEYGTPDVVVYNTRLTAPDPENLTAETLVEHFKTDVAGAYTTVITFADSDFAAKKGAIIFTGGGFALYPVDGYLPLSIDKSALRTMAYLLNAKYKDCGIFIGTITVCGAINSTEYFAADNIAQLYWEMVTRRDKCEYACQLPSLKPEKIYDDTPVHYGMFEENAENYWTEVSNSK